MDKTNPYPTLLGIDWAFENYAIINLKNETMTLKAEGMRVTQPLDPYKGPRDTEPVNENMERDVLDQIDNLTAGKRNDYINPIADGSVSWRSIHLPMFECFNVSGKVPQIYGCGSL